MLSACAQIDSTNPGVRTDPGIIAPSRRQTGWLDYIDLPVDGFAVLAAIDAILRQFPVASRLGLDDPGSLLLLPE
jgi:hypothetical protein